ncbi:MAG: 7-carboxy-7-deazaguanine synthase QueE [Gammaproteobacteria bacterium]|jgi:7-carboxy-7-deazaguanine synthase
MADTVETGAGAAERLRITEIFLSLQGEAASVGWPTVFVRLTGCPLRCGYCDTAYAFHGGQWMSLDEILGAIAGFGVKHVCVTGGEPLAQRRCLELLRRLCNAGYLVSLETSGALDTSGVDPRVTQVLDMKTPGSGEVDRNLMANLGRVGPKDVVKFVICDRNDYEWAGDMVRSKQLSEKTQVFFSPSWGQLEPSELAEWVLADRLGVRVQIQLHKVIWGDVPGK